MHAARSSHEKAVCPSVKRVDCDKTEERSARIFYTLRKVIYPSFRIKRTVGGGDPFYLKFWVQLTLWSEIANFQSIFARSASAVTPSK